MVREKPDMFSTIEVAAKGLLNDPSWNWVFKNTFDAIEDKLNKVCTALMPSVMGETRLNIFFLLL